MKEPVQELIYFKTMEVYKNWEIRKSDYAVGYYEATNLNDCDAFMKHAKSIEELKIEIDNEHGKIRYIKEKA